MGDWVKVLPFEDLPEDRGVRVEARGHPIAVFRMGDEVYAIGDVCSHAEASLADGELFDYEVECPRHGSEFDIRTGEPASLPATRPVPVYEAQLRNGDVYLFVEESG
jgi:3-phenylpropionate/trans-cinnamate dioxygenase ferredoxin subunit